MQSVEVFTSADTTLKQKVGWSLSNLLPESANGQGWSHHFEMPIEKYHGGFSVVKEINPPLWNAG